MGLALWARPIVMADCGPILGLPFVDLGSLDTSFVFFYLPFVCGNPLAVRYIGSTIREIFQAIPIHDD